MSLNHKQSFLAGATTSIVAMSKSNFVGIDFSHPAPAPAPPPAPAPAPAPVPAPAPTPAPAPAPTPALF